MSRKTFKDVRGRTDWHYDDKPKEQTAYIRSVAHRPAMTNISTRA